MGKLVVMRPGARAILVDHEGKVHLQDLYDTIGCSTVDLRSFGRIREGSSVYADMWFDDNGLLDPDVPPNRRIVNHAGGDEEVGPIICGAIVVCARVGEDHEALSDEDAQVVMRHVEQWDILSPLSPKPDPSFHVYEMPRGRA